MSVETPTAPTRGEWLLTVVLVVVCVLAAVLASLPVDSRYTAAASFERTSDLSRRSVRADIERDRDRALKALGYQQLAVQISARPGDPRVTVRTTAATVREAVDFGNVVTAEIVAHDLGVNRERVANRIQELTAELEGLEETKPRYGRVEARLESLQASQISDASFAAAQSATRTQAPHPVRNGLYAVPLGLLVAATCVLLLRRIRQTGAPEPIRS